MEMEFNEHVWYVVIFDGPESTLLRSNLIYVKRR